jgi:hypothetical protein
LYNSVLADSKKSAIPGKAKLWYKQVETGAIDYAKTMIQTLADIGYLDLFKMKQVALCRENVFVETRAHAPERKSGWR